MKKKYIYNESTSYTSTRKSLRKGVTTKKVKVIKIFRCSCSQHEKTALVVLVPEDTKHIHFDQCKFLAKRTLNIAVDSNGIITLDGYKYYAKHFDWKVRAAVAAGLNKIRDDDVIEILSKLAKDPHFGVISVAIQALENINSKLSLYTLKQLASLSGQGKCTQRLATQAIQRRNRNAINFNVSTKQICRQIYHKNVVRQNSCKKTRADRLLLTPNLYEMCTAEIYLHKEYLSN